MLSQKILAASIAALPLAGLADPVSLDGNIGAEWNGVSFVSVTQDPNAALGNFGTPGTVNHQTGYEVGLRSDDSFVYAAIRTTGGGDAGGLMFSNLYFSLRFGDGPVGNNGSSIAFEVMNDRAFAPLKPTYLYDDSGTGAGAGLIQWASSEGGVDVIEMAIDWSVFTDNALHVRGFGLPLGATAAGLRLNLSQSFGYSVAGGERYGDNGLGFVAMPNVAVVPEPGTLALTLTGAALIAPLALKRRRA